MTLTSGVVCLFTHFFPYPVGLLDLDKSAGAVLQRAEDDERHRQEDMGDEQAEEQAKRVQKAKGKKTSVLTQKLAVLAISIGKVGVVAAVLTVLGLIVRTLIDIYSDCSSCKSTDEWGRFICTT